MIRFAPRSEVSRRVSYTFAQKEYTPGQLLRRVASAASRSSPAMRLAITRPCLGNQPIELRNSLSGSQGKDGPVKIRWRASSWPRPREVLCSKIWRVNLATPPCSGRAYAGLSSCYPNLAKNQELVLLGFDLPKNLLHLDASMNRCSGFSTSALKMFKEGPLPHFQQAPISHSTNCASYVGVSGPVHDLMLPVSFSDITGKAYTVIV